MALFAALGMSSVPVQAGDHWLSRNTETKPAPRALYSESSMIKATAGSNSFTWVYDYGDYWEHKVKVERIVDLGVPLDTAMCITGRNACPPEDVGGVPGYAEFLEAIRDPANPEHLTMRQWCGGAFDPSAFDPMEAQERLDAIKL